VWPTTFVLVKEGRLRRASYTASPQPALNTCGKRGLSPVTEQAPLTPAGHCVFAVVRHSESMIAWPVPLHQGHALRARPAPPAPQSPHSTVDVPRVQSLTRRRVLPIAQSVAQSRPPITRLC